ncbi:MAG TPA: helix-turn-helix transcriptional regulator [Candidatus Sulfotelmatobacter sp.]|nr:helix-turn-helix transcriptional regulator [Candidatus Sulfotelmatobacter sp.]
MSCSTDANTGNARSELATFLRTKRKQITPSTYGFMANGKRRTVGLRREEVAELANVGSTWYTWLEQGRDIRPSVRVLSNIAAVLQLNTVETQYLFELAGRPPQHPDVADDVGEQPSLRDVVDEFRCPAFVRNGRYDILVWNREFAAIFGMRPNAQALERNFLWRLLRQEWGPAHLANFEPLARACVADFRMTYARRGAPPSFAALAEQLNAISPLFVKWWAEYAVDEIHEVLQPVEHDRAGELLLRFKQFDVVEQPGLKLVLFSPQTGSDTAEKIALLGGSSA